MERIEIPAEVYYVARDGKKFIREAECARYEYLLDKYMNSARHVVCEDGEGKLQHFFYAWNKEEAEEIGEWSRWLQGYTCKLPTDRPWEGWMNGWLWVPNDNEAGYGPCPMMQTITDFIILQEECAKGYNQAIRDAKQIRSTPVPRS